MRSKTKDLTEMSLWCALMIGIQWVFSFVYGIELLSLLMVLCGTIFGKYKGAFTAFTFAILRNLIYSFAFDVFILNVTFWPLFVFIVGFLYEKFKPDAIVFRSEERRVGKEC